MPKASLDLLAALTSNRLSLMLWSRCRLKCRRFLRGTSASNGMLHNSRGCTECLRPMRLQTAQWMPQQGLQKVRASPDMCTDDPGIVLQDPEFRNCHGMTGTYQSCCVYLDAESAHHHDHCKSNKVFLRLNLGVGAKRTAVSTGPDGGMMQPNCTEMRPANAPADGSGLWCHGLQQADALPKMHFSFKCQDRPIGAE